jgi:hypothetical protein
MQVGEPAAVIPAPPPPPDCEFAAELLSVTFKSSEKVSHERKTIEGPHWVKGEEGKLEDFWSRLAGMMGLSAEPYSKRPAVYRVKGMTAAHIVEVKVNVTKSANIAGSARLIGKLWSLSIEGVCPTSVGEHIVRAEIKDAPEEIRGYRGRIAWHLETDAPAMNVALRSTLAEVYFILDRPSAFYRNLGVWVEVLRFLCGRVGVAGECDRKAVGAKVASYCHGRHGLKYETRHGRSQYGVGHTGGTFNLTDYLIRKSPVCNCYDQAAAVQALAGAVGAQTVWLFLEPFGYIKPTNLVGVGLCNNPFFRSDESQKLIDPESLKRTAFANHAFVVTYGATVLDACAKPHLATETPEEYVADSIDRDPSLYDRSFRPGRPQDIRPQIGVREVS